VLQRIAIAWLGVGAALGLGIAGAAHAQSFRVERLATGLALPVFATSAQDGSGRLFVLEQHSGKIRILRLATRTLVATPFLTVPPVSQGEEQGLLGLAFDPQYATNGFFYVSYTDPTRRIVRYHVSANPDVADASSATPILSYTQPAENHNGGWIGFGPDGLLYIANGDGGNNYDDGGGHTPGIATRRTSPTTGSARSCASTCAATTSRPIPRATTRSRRPTRSSASRATTRSGRTGCAIRGGRASTARRATSGSPTSARICAKRSTSTRTSAVPA
jgi:glucose/arabinose dehydrogenase